MPETLLQTKLYIPPLRPNVVPRSRLIEQLNCGLQQGSKLTLVSAPAGYGKTTLLSEWVQQAQCPTTWLSLDQDDNDPYRFWAYFVVALQTIQADFGQATLTTLQSSQRPSIKTVLTNLINEIAEIPGQFVLILDDLHVITARQINDDVALLLNNQPPQMHMMLSTRVDPPWPLARLRAQGEITELRHADLRFTTHEATAFLNDTMDLNLTSDEVAALEFRIEGWVAGLQMAAVSMKGSEDITEFISSFTGSHRYILDYLMEEVLGQQPVDIQTFLLKTSILERMTASLCDAVMGERACESGDDQASSSLGSQAILARLEQANLFLVPLDNERRWYRYHHLFADLLRSRLSQARSDDVPNLHLRASRWYEINGLIADAVSHAFAADDLEQVVRLVEGNALAILDRGELSVLARWLNMLPKEMVITRPWMSVAHAWVMLYTGRLDAVEPLLQSAENALIDFEAPTESRRISGHISAILAYLVNIKGDKPHAIEIAREALDRLPEPDMMARGFATGTLATALRYTGDLAGAAQAYDEAIAMGPPVSCSHIGVDVVCDLAILQMMKGHLRMAAATLQKVLKIADKGLVQTGSLLPYTWYAYTVMSSILLEWNDLEAAIRSAKKGFEAADKYGNPILMKMCYPELARVLQAAGDPKGALDAIQKAKDASRDVSPWLFGLAATSEASLCLQQGDIAGAARWAQRSGVSSHDEITFQYEFWYRTLARLLIIQGKPGDALGLLARLLKVVEKAGAMGYVVEILILQAIAMQGKGKSDQALTKFDRALSIAEPEGYVRTFIDEGEPMANLLRQALTRGTAVDYTGRLLAALEEETKDKQWMTRPASSPLVEPLTDRELEVMRLLTTHVTSTDIAGQLTISVNTVRTHIKNIYSKLDVHSREEAVQKTEKLNLL